MFVETTQIVFGPGRFMEIGTVAEFPEWEGLELINAGKARRVEAPEASTIVETADQPAAPENATHSPHLPRQRPPKRSS